MSISLGALAAVSGGSSVIQGLGSYFGAKYSADKQYKMWHEQRDWNTPAAQMQRYKEAGLNPNLIYGNVESGNLTNMPGVPDYSQVAGAAANGLSKGLENYLIAKNAKAQYAKLEAEADAAKATADNIRANTANTRQDTSNKIIQNGILLSDSAIRSNEAEISNTYGLTNARISYEQSIEVLKNLISSGKLTEQERINLEAKKRFLEEQVKKIGIDIRIADVERRRLEWYNNDVYGYSPKNHYEAGYYLGRVPIDKRNSIEEEVAKITNATHQIYMDNVVMPFTYGEREAVGQVRKILNGMYNLYR